MNYKQISNEIWLESEPANPIYLCQTLFSVLEIEKSIGVVFETVEEDGLGDVFYCFLYLNNKQILLKGFVKKSKKDDVAVCVYMHSNESCPKSLIDHLLALLSIKESELREFGKYLESPKYILSRLDDNNEIEINRFHDKNLAKYFKKRYQDKGHKQDYYVNKVK